MGICLSTAIVSNLDIVVLGVVVPGIVVPGAAAVVLGACAESSNRMIVQCLLKSFKELRKAPHASLFGRACNLVSCLAGNVRRLSSVYKRKIP